MRKNWYVLLLAALWLLCALIPTAIAEDAINVVGNFELSLNEEPSVATDGLEVPSVDGIPEIDPDLDIVLGGASDDGQQPVEDDPLALSLDDGIPAPDENPEGQEAAQAIDSNDGPTFEIDEKGVLIKYNGPGGAVTIPRMVNSIGAGAFYNCQELTSVTVPGSVKVIGWRAFENCRNLESVTLEAGVEVLDEDAFRDCRSLKALPMPDGLKAVRDGAFVGCCIEELIFPDSVTELSGGATFDRWNKGPLSGSLKKVHWPAGVLDINDSQFEGFSELTEIQIPANLESIGIWAFSRCINLKVPDIPATVKSIGEGAFHCCDGLTSITIPDGVPAIGDLTFSDCDNLTEIVVPGSVKVIGEGAFKSCDRLDSVTLKAGVEVIDVEAFRDCDSLKTLTMADGLKTIKSSAFVGCRIEELIFPDSVTELAEGATFGGYYNGPLCESLKKVRWPAGVKDIHKDQFHGFTALTEIQIPVNLESIGERAFVNCSSLKKINIPATVNNIGEEAFWNCDGLTVITIPNGVPFIGDNTFFDCDNLTSIVVPGSVKTVGESAFEGCDRLGSVTLEEGVEMLDVGAFRNCESLKTLTMANGLETLKEGVFFNTPLKALNFPDSVTELGKDAISGDPLRKSLKSVHWPAGITEIQEEQFRYFTALKDVFIPKGVTTIGENAFLNCTKLSIVNISSTVKKIADGSFESCPKLEIWAPVGSTAEKFAHSNGIPVVHTDDKGREILPKSVKLNKTKATLVVGDKLMLKATVTPSTATPRFTWTSSNKKVATVSKNGEVKALKKGAVTITVKTSNGKKATCKITVPAAPTGVTLNKTKATLKVGGKLTLKPKLKGAGAKTTFTWTSSNKKIATVSSKGVVKARKKGTVKITVRTANGKKATCKITVK